jgi:hypothetical protein
MPLLTSTETRITAGVAHSGPGVLPRSIRLAAVLVLGISTGTGTAAAATGPTTPQVVTADAVVSYGPSDADSIALLAGTYYVNAAQAAGGLPFWWDHTDLTVAVQSAPTTNPDSVQAARDAIAVWNSVLAEQLPGISLTDVSAGSRNPSSADIVIHLVPHAGGIVWGGNTHCGPGKCQNVLVKSDMPPGHLGNGEPDIVDFDPLRVERETLHELGHALGLGHTTPLIESIDIMAYGWAVPDPDVTPIISSCDLDGIRTAFGWFYDSEPAHASPIPNVACSAT